jgi:hypothetical protein
MVDTLETAQSYGIRLDAPTGKMPLSVRTSSYDPTSFDSLMKVWLPVTLALNGLNRSMGLPDAYPFSLSDVVRSKLSFVHSVIQDSRGTH